MKKESTRQVTYLALLTAIQIILSRFLSIPTPITKIGFAFLPIALAGILYGPLAAGTVGAVGDLIGAVLFPIGAYFPGFTLTAFLSGVVYGLLLKGHSQSWGRIIAAVLIISVVLHWGLNTYWLSLITGKGVWALLPPRLIQAVIQVPLQIVAIRMVGSRRCLALLEH